MAQCWKNSLWFVIVSFIVACGGGAEVDFARSLAVKAPADLVLRGGKIVTVDNEFSIREAVAIKDGRFLAVGTERDVRPLIGPRTRVIDLAGRTVIPGLVDARIHATAACVNWNSELHWQTTRTLADALNQISAAAKLRPRGSWIVVGGGWVPTQFAERRFPTRADLDAAAPDHPVYIQYLNDGALLNSAGLAALKIDSRSADPAGGKFERNPKTGELSGWLQGESAWRFAYDKIPAASLDAARQNMRSCVHELLRLGITSIGDVQTRAVTFAHRRMLFDLARAGELLLRVNFYIGVDGSRGDMERLKLAAEEIKNLGAHELLRFAGFAWTGDGEDDLAPPPNGVTRKTFRTAAQFFLENGYNFQLNAANDAAVRPLLDVLEEIHGATPVELQRIVFAGIDDVTLETAERIRKIGGAIAVQSNMALSGERNAERWGLEKTRNAPPLRRLVESGMPMGAGSGAFRAANYSPMLTLWWLVTGKTVAGSALRSPQQNLTRAEALRLHTMGGAWLTLEEGRKGSIEVGKYADLAVLNADYLGVAEEQIRSLESLLTVIGGRIVYAAAPFEAAGTPKGRR
jgi:predicted amidohydrolase YtcJ